MSISRFGRCSISHQRFAIKFASRKRCAGPLGAPPLVLLHALGESRRDWDAVAARFAELFHVIAVDLRAHGASDWPGAYSFQLMADNVRAADRLAVGGVGFKGPPRGGRAEVGYGVATVLATRPTTTFPPSEHLPAQGFTLVGADADLQHYEIRPAEPST